MRRIRFLIPFLLFAIAGESASAERFHVRKTFEIGASDLVPAPWRQAGHDIASSGDRSFVVWTDNRSGEGSEVRGALIRADGTVEPPAGTRIAGPGDDSGFPVEPLVVAGDDRFLVVWHTSQHPARSRGQLFDLDGKPVGTQIQFGEPVRYRRIIVANGSSFLVYEQQALTLVRSDGSTERLPVGELDPYNVISAASLKGEFIFIANDYVSSSETFLRVSPSGEIEVIPLDLDRRGERLELISSGGALYVVIGGSPIRILHIDLDDQSATPVTVPPSAPSGSIWWLESGADGTLLFSWEISLPQTESRELLVMRIDPRDGSHTSASTGLSGRHPIATVSHGDDVRLMFLQGPESGLDLTHVLLGDDLKPNGPVSSLIRTRASQSSPALAQNSAATIAFVWEEEREGRPQIASTLAGRNGPASDSAFLDPSPAHQTNPAIASDGAGFLVVWRSALDYEERVFARRLAADGEPLDPGPIPLSPPGPDNGDPGRIAVVWTGQDYLVAYVEPGYPLIIRVRRITSAGEVHDDPGPVPVSGRSAEQIRPAMAVAGDATVLLVWQDGGDFDSCPFTCPSTAPGRIMGVRISSESTFLDPVPIEISSDDAVHRRPVVAASGPLFLVAWERQTSLRATRVTRSGAVLDHDGQGRGVELPGQTFETPAADSFGRGFLLSWIDSQGRWGMQNDLVALEIGGDGLVSSRAVISTAVQREPAALALDGNSLLLINTQLSQPAGGVKRLSARLIEEGEPVKRRRAVRR